MSPDGPVGIASLSEPERKNLAGLFACLVRTEGRHVEWERRTREALFVHLGLSEQARDEVVSLADGGTDAGRFASGLPSRETRGMILEDLLDLSLSGGGYDARARLGLRRVAAALDVSWRRVTSWEDERAAGPFAAPPESAAGSPPAPAPWWRKGAPAMLQLEHIGGRGLVEIIGVSGFLSETTDFRENWKGLPASVSHGVHYALRWESGRLRKLGAWLGELSRGVPSKRVHLIENPWHTAVLRADVTGRLLAGRLDERKAGVRPVILVGFSLGSRVIFHCLEELARRDRGDIVYNAVMLGSAVTPHRERWEAARRAVAGRLVNAYSTSDRILQVIYRPAQLTSDAAGLGPLGFPGVEDIDLTQLAGGHLTYRRRLKAILDEVGLDP